MEGIHGVDTSWLHHSKAPGQRPAHASTPSSSSIPEQPQPAATTEALPTRTSGRSSPDASNGAVNGTVNGASDHASEPKQHDTHTPLASLAHFGRKISEKESLPAIGEAVDITTPAAAPATPPQMSGQAKGRSPSPALGRKSSWISSMSSKFSLSKNHEQKDLARHAQQNNAASKTAPSPKAEKTDPLSVSGKEAKPEPSTGSTPPRPGGFLSSALRRFSSSSGSAVSKTVPNGGVCPRRVMNLDPHRERCEITDLQGAKLRRVTFCVDVEIAATPKYRDDSPEDPTVTAAQQQRKRSNSGSEKKSKVKNKERSEGEALKNPDAMAEQKEKTTTRSRANSEDMFEIPDVDEAPPKTANPAKVVRRPSPPMTEPAKPRQARVTSPLTSPLHNDFGPSSMFEVDEVDELAQSKPKVPQRAESGGSPHHDFGRHGMFEIPSEDEAAEPTAYKSRRRTSSNVSADKAMALQMGTKPPGHVFTEHLMFEIPDADLHDETAVVVDAVPPVADTAAETSEPASQPDGVSVADGAADTKADKKTDGTSASETADGAKPAEAAGETVPAPSRKKEKKKKSEEERKERKEKKKQAAIANGSIPVELTGGDASSASGPQQPSKPKSQNRPTTDPLRVYRRCCSLRETAPLPRVVEQLSSPTVCDPLNPATVLCLDLSNETISVQDLVTLGDWLGVVPVQKILLENAGLTDESVRIVLCGLLTVKTSEQARHNKHLARKHDDKSKGKKERLGVVSKISLKNNRLIGRQGWMHIAYFINMSRSLKAIDLSLIPFPKAPVHSPVPKVVAGDGLAVTSRPGSGNSDESASSDPFDVFAKCIAERQGGDALDEVVIGECENLTGDRVEKLINAIIACRCSRFGLANNNLDRQGLLAVAKYIRSGSCLGLDLGGNDLSNPENQRIILEALDCAENKMLALSLAHSNLTPADLKTVLPILTRLTEFRFIDLSHNHKLFESKPDALGPLSRYFPRMPNLKRFHLNDVSMTPEQAIALAEICPEIPSLAHVSILENPALTALADAKDEEAQEEACALYASLMAATRVSRTIVCIDIDVPSKDNSEVVKALAKQVVAYSLRNMERGEAYKSAAALISEPHGGEKAVTVPDVLLHLVGHVDNLDDHDDDPPAPDQDYLVGGTGVVKALSVVLGNRSNHRDSRRLSRDATPVTSGASTPKLGDSFAKGKAKDMSRNLLESARKIRHRLQPALVRARADASDDLMGSENYRRLFYLDNTLERMIQRFEEEYPECRPPRPQSIHAGSPLVTSSVDPPTSLASPFPLNDPLDDTAVGSADEDGDGSAGSLASSLRRSRHGSDVSLASRNLVNEEGRIHRFGARVKREILPPVHTVDHHWGTKGDGAEPEHLNELRARLDSKGGDEIRREIQDKGADVVLKEMNATVEALRALKDEGGGAWEKCVGAGIAAFYLGNETRANELVGAKVEKNEDAVGEEEDSGLEMTS